MPRPDRRRSPRVAVWLRTTVRVGDAVELAYAGEIGLRGAYIATPNPRPRRQLLTLTAALPDGGELDVHCMVVRAVTADEARLRSIPPGMAVQFYGLSKQAAAEWEKSFFRVLTGRSPRTSPEASESDAEARAPKPPSLVIVSEDEDPFGSGAAGARHAPEALGAPSPRAGEEPSDAVAPRESKAGEGDAPWGSWFDYFLGAGVERERLGDEDRTHEPPARRAPPGGERRAEAPASTVGPVLYRIALPGIPALRGFARTALSARGIFVRTPDVLPPGTPAVVCVVHPDTGDEFHLPGEVVEMSTESQGVAVALDGVTARTMSDFEAFVSHGRDVPSEPLPRSEGPEPETLAHTSRPRPQYGDETLENAEEVQASALMVLTTTGGGGSDGAEDIEELSVADLIEVDDD